MKFFPHLVLQDTGSDCMANIKQSPVQTQTQSFNSTRETLVITRINNQERYLGR